MKRLTFDGNFCDIAWCKATPEECPHKFCSQRQTWERLKLIEDALGDEYDVEQLRELVQADREGRCVVLPVKLGDKVYRIMYRVHEETQKAEKCVDSGTVDFIQSVPDLFVSNGFVYKFTEIGKTVFLSREAAEAAMKGENENGMDQR